MKTKLFTSASALLLAAGLLAGCGAPKTPPATPPASGTPENSVSAPAPAATAEPKEIYMFVSCPENAEAMAAAIEEYKTVAPNITINYETTQSDYPTLLKAKINSGEMPDIFASTGGQEIAAYAEYSYDLSNEPLAASLTDAAKATMMYDGKLHGIPVISNAFGMMYNAELMKKAGVESMPQTYTELEAACQKLSAAGIQPFTNGFKEWWEFKYIFQNFVDAAQPENPGELIESFIAGTKKLSEYPQITDNFFRYIDLLVKYGDAKPLETDLNAQITAFGTGKAAMLTGTGAPMEPSVKQIDPALKISFCGYQVDDNANNFFITCGAEQSLRVNKSSKVLKETLDFLNWLYTSDYGKTWFPEVMKAIPPIKGAASPSTDIATEAATFAQTREPGVPSVVYSLDSFHQKFGEIMQGYIAKTITKEQAVLDIEKAWIELGAAK